MLCFFLNNIIVIFFPIQTALPETPDIKIFLPSNIFPVFNMHSSDYRTIIFWPPVFPEKKKQNKRKLSMSRKTRVFLSQTYFAKETSIFFLLSYIYTPFSIRKNETLSHAGMTIALCTSYPGIMVRAWKWCIFAPAHIHNNKELQQDVATIG